MDCARGVTGLNFAGYVLLVSQKRYPILVYFVAKYRPHLRHFWRKCNFRDPNVVTLFMHLIYKAF